MILIKLNIYNKKIYDNYFHTVNQIELKLVYKVTNRIKSIN